MSQTLPPVYQRPQSVIDLDTAVKTLWSAVNAMAKQPKVAPGVARTAQAISDAVMSACDHVHLTALPLLVSAHVSITTQMVSQCTELLHGNSGTNYLLRWFWDKRAEQLKAQHEALRALEAMAKIKDGVSTLILRPADGLGLSQANAHHDRLGLERITTFKSAIKVTLTAMANMCDGAMWPLKALPQTLLQLFTLAESTQGLSSRINDLVCSISRRVEFLFKFFADHGCIEDDDLNKIVEAFFVDVQRIIIRLSCIKAMSKYKSVVNSEVIDKVIIEEQTRMTVAIDTLQSSGIFIGLGYTTRMHKAVHEIHAAVVPSSSLSSSRESSGDSLSPSIATVSSASTLSPSSPNSPAPAPATPTHGSFSQAITLSPVTSEADLTLWAMTPSRIPPTIRSKASFRGDSIVVTCPSSPLAIPSSPSTAGDLQLLSSSAASTALRAPHSASVIASSDFEPHLSPRRASLLDSLTRQPPLSQLDSTLSNFTTQRPILSSNLMEISSNPDVLLSATTARNIHRSLPDVRGIDGVLVPPRPKFFFGRQEEVSRLVDMALDQTRGNARIVIKGSAGMGKTTLATAVLTDKRVKQTFGSSRVFIRCSELKEANRGVHGLLCNLALKLGLTEDGDLYTKVESLLRAFGRSIVVLDGLEAIWNSKNSSAEIEAERLIDLLADIDEVVLIATVRGKAVPQNVPWRNRIDDPLGSLSPQDACNTFLQRTDCKQSHYPAERYHLEELLAEVDYHPQAVVLLARLGDPPSSLTREWNRWKGWRTEMIEADHHDGKEPELSMCVSIMLSVRLLPEDNPRPLDLLKTCQEQNGLTKEHQEELRATWERFDRQRRLLERPGLVHADESGNMMINSLVRNLNVTQGST